MQNEVVLKADKSVFARSVVLAQSRFIDVATVLQYPLGLLPWALATVDGRSAKTNKAALLHLLESAVPPEENMAVGVWIIDSMAPHPRSYCTKV